MKFNLPAFAEMLLEIAGSRATNVNAYEWLEAAIDNVDRDYRKTLRLCESRRFDRKSASQVGYSLVALKEYREALALVEDYFFEGGAEYLEEATLLAASAQRKMDAALCYAA